MEASKLKIDIEAEQKMLEEEVMKLTNERKFHSDRQTYVKNKPVSKKQGHVVVGSYKFKSKK